MTGEMIDVAAKDGGRFQAYLAKPAQGSGPGLVLLQEVFGVTAFLRAQADLFAGEGYVVLVPDLFWRQEPGLDLGYEGADREKALALYRAFDVDKAVEDIGATLQALRARPEHRGRLGALGYCLGGRLAFLTAARCAVDCAVSYYGVGLENHLDEAGGIACPLVLHVAEQDDHVPPEAVARVRQALSDHRGVSIYGYPGAGHAFARPGGAQYDKPAAMMAHSRSLALLRGVLGPVFDLGALWDLHCHHEFAARDVDATMATMVAEPYVNHVPTMTGGVGHDHLKRFYRHHFVNSNPPDTRLIPISRTIGTDRLVDEMLFCFTHSCEIDWMLPGIEPTGAYVEVPLVAIVCFRGDKLYNEHIYWDQASVLVQIGKLDPAGLPVAGRATAQKLVDETRPSNALMGARWDASAGKPV